MTTLKQFLKKHYPLILAILIVAIPVGAVSIFQVQQGGTGVGTIIAGQLIYGDGIYPFGSVATTTVSCSGSASCTSFTAIGGSPITITASGGSGSGNVSTSTNETAGRIAYWTSNSGTPALLGEVATSSLSVASSLSTSGTLGSQIGGTASQLSINTANTNTWSVLQNFNYSSTTGQATFENASSTLASIGTLTLGTPLTVANGGTGQTTLTQNAVLYGLTQGAVGLAPVTTNGVLWANNSSPSFTGAPILSTSVRVPLVIGGASANSTLILESTSIDGTSDAIIFKTASQNERARIVTSGNFGIATSTPQWNFQVASTSMPQISLTGNATDNHWTMRSIGNAFYLATASPTTFSTSSVTAFSIDKNGQPTIPYLGSALTLSSAGALSGYGGTSCSNQFVRSLSAVGSALCQTVTASDVSLANLTATDGTLTFSGTYDGSAARTIGLNLGNSNTWTVKQSFNYSSTSLYASFVQASSTNWRGGGLGTCSGTDFLQYTASGFFTCGTPAGSGDITGGASLGTGLTIYDSEATGILRFNTIAAGTNVTLSTTTNSNTIVINSSGGGSFPFDSTVGGYVSTSTTVGFLNGLFSTASSTFSSNLFLSSIGQGILTTGSSGIVKAVATSSFSLSGFTNDLASLSATDSTLTFSGSYNGATARTVGINLGNSNTWTVLQNFNYSSSTIMSSFVYASTTKLTFGGVTGTAWTDFCTSITGGAGLCDGNDATGAGGSFPFDSTVAGYVSTTTTIGLLNGLFSTASSTFSSNLFFTGLNSVQGSLYTGSLGKVQTVATTSVGAGTGISLSANAGALLGGSNLTITNSGVISGSCSGGTVCSGTNPLAISSFSFPFDIASHWQQTTAGTSTALWLQGTPISLFASSTAVFDYASTTKGFGLGTDFITDITGTGLQIVSNALTLNATGDWTGTIDGNNFAGGAIGQGDLLYGDAAGSISELAKDTNSTRYLSNQGASNNPSWNQVNLTNGVTGALPVANGGTNSTAFANNSIITSNGVGTTLIATSSNPLWLSSLIATSTINNSGIGTTTPWGYFSINPSGLGTNVPAFAIGSSTKRLFEINATFATTTFLSGTTTVFDLNTAATISAGQGTGTTTVNIGEIGLSNGHSCVNMMTNTGSINSFYIRAGTMIVEQNACR